MRRCRRGRFHPPVVSTVSELAALAPGAGGSCHGNGVSCPGRLSGGPLRSRQRHRRLAFRTFRFFHSALVKIKALTPPLRRFARNCVLPARSLQKHRRGPRVGTGAPRGRCAQPADVHVMGRNEPLVFGRRRRLPVPANPNSGIVSYPLGVESCSGSSLGTLCPSEWCEPPSEASLSGDPPSPDTCPASALRVVTGDTE